MKATIKNGLLRTVPAEPVWLKKGYDPKGQKNSRTAKAIAFARRKNEPVIRLGRLVIGK